MIGGAMLVLLGLLALATPVFTTQETRDVAQVGNLKPQTTENRHYSIPPFVGGGALTLGVVLIGAGFYRKR
jgi:hypothetical protein